MGKKAAADPNEGLADDTTLATDIKDEGARTDEQLEYFGGDKDTLDSEDFSEADRGDALESDEDEDEDEDKGDEAEDTEEEEADDESEDEGDAADDEEESDDDEDDASEDASEDEDADESDDDDSAEDDSDDDEVEPEPDAKAKRGIPLSRFNEVNERMKTAEAEIAVLKADKTAEADAEVEEYDFDAAEKEYMDLLLAGKVEDAAVVRRTIRAAEKADFTASAKKETKAEVNQDSMQSVVDSLAVQAEDMFPEFNPKSDDYKPALVQKVQTFMRGYQSEGVKPDDALVAAIADVAEMYDLATESKNDDRGDENDDTEEKPEKKGKKKKAPIKKVKEKLDLAKKQGKSPAGEGKGSSEAGAVVPDVEKMSDEDLDALPPETLARIRGDYAE